MALRFVLDTNVLAEPLKTQPDAGVMRKLQKHDGELSIPTPVWHEMWFGCLRLPRGKRRGVIEKYLVEVLHPSVPLLPYSAEAAKWHAAQRVRLINKGRTPTFVDGQIAAIAAEQDLTLVTANVRDFKAYSGVKVVDWRELGSGTNNLISKKAQTKPKGYGVGSKPAFAQASRETCHLRLVLLHCDSCVPYC